MNRWCLMLGLLSAHVLVSRSSWAAPGEGNGASPSGSPAVVDAANNPFLEGKARPSNVEIDPVSGACNMSPFSDEISERCFTPRPGVLSGGYLALDVGVVSPSRSASERVGVGWGPTVGIRLGLEFGDILVLGLGFAGISLHDQQSYSELVVDCTTVGGQIIDCGDDPHSESSTVGAPVFTMEAGLQHRFRPFRTTSWSPGLMFGYSTAIGGLERSVNCSGCSSTQLDMGTTSAYLAPFFRVTFGQMGNYAAVLRSSWFLGGDIQQVSTLGIEVFAP